MAVEMEHKCMECKKWNEHWYWTHLQHTHIRFSSLLTSGFHQQLILPRRIVFKFRELLVNTITLKSLLSGKAWTIGLEERDEHLVLNHGWPAFVEGHSLKEGDILTFQYEGASTFAVSMFDRKSGYEKVGSCFNHGLPSNWETTETTVHVESMNSSSDESDDSISLENGKSETETIKIETESEDDNPPMKKARKIERSSRTQLRSNHPSISSKGKSICKETNSIESEDDNPPMKKARKIERSSRMQLRSNHPSTSSKGKSICKEPNSIDEQSFTQDTDTAERIINLDQRHPMPVLSQRRPAMQTEKEKPYKLARAFQSSKSTIPSFTVTMVRTSVGKNYFMTIPRIFAKEHIPISVKEVVLHVPPGVKKWVVTYSGYLEHVVGRKLHGVGLRRGWKSFVLDNNLGKGDVCKFELIQPQGNRDDPETIAMDVKILSKASQYLRKQGK